MSDMQKYYRKNLCFKDKDKQERLDNIVSMLKVKLNYKDSGDVVLQACEELLEKLKRS